MTQDQKIEDALLRLIQHGRDRCGAGFGKYPLGIREAVNYFFPLAPSEKVAERLRDFDNRLAR